MTYGLILHQIDPFDITGPQIEHSYSWPLYQTGSMSHMHLTWLMNDQDIHVTEHGQLGYNCTSQPY